MTETNRPTEVHGAAAVELARTMRKVKVDPQTWEAEYVDDATGQRWTLDHPASELHGGGPPRLRRIR
jgi:hypothetical protein